MFYFSAVVSKPHLALSSRQRPWIILTVVEGVMSTNSQKKEEKKSEEECVKNKKKKWIGGKKKNTQHPLVQRQTIAVTFPALGETVLHPNTH